MLKRVQHDSSFGPVWCRKTIGGFVVGNKKQLLELKYRKKLKFRNTILVYLKINDQNLFPDQWIYVHSAEMKTGRITNFSNWVPTINQNKKETILCLEYWCNDEDPQWTADDQKLIDTAINDISLSTLVNKKAITEGKVIRVPKCYPVYSSGYKDNLKPIENYLSEYKTLSVIGRYGAFKYNNQDHSILMGIMAADNILNNANNWYQKSSL